MHAWIPIYTTKRVATRASSADEKRHRHVKNRSKSLCLTHSGIQNAEKFVRRASWQGHLQKPRRPQCPTPPSNSRMCTCSVHEVGTKVLVELSTIAIFDDLRKLPRHATIVRQVLERIFNLLFDNFTDHERGCDLQNASNPH